MGRVFGVLWNEKWYDIGYFCRFCKLVGNIGK